MATTTKCPVITARCKICKQIVAAQTIVGEAAALGQFLLDNVKNDFAVSRPCRVTTIGGGCVCAPEAAGEAEAAKTARNAKRKAIKELKLVAKDQETEVAAPSPAETGATQGEDAK